MLKEIGDWRRQEEANNCLRRRFEESRQELERVLKKAQDCLRETGDAEDLLKNHSVRSKLLYKYLKGTVYRISRQEWWSLSVYCFTRLLLNIHINVVYTYFV